MEEEKKDNSKFSLLFWAGFLLFVLLFVRLMNSNLSDSSSSSKARKNLTDNYEFVYSNSEGNIYGMAFGNKYLFVLKDNKYYYNGNNLYLVSEHSLKETSTDIGIVRITPLMIDNLIKEKQSTDNSYYVSLYDFMNVYDADVPVDGSEASKYNIVINKYYKDDKLYMIKLDLSNYYLFKGVQDTGLITIDLYNFGNVSDFSKEYEGLGVIE